MREGYDWAVNVSLLVAYLVTVTVLMLTPGPDMLFALASGLKSGPRAGFLAAVGAASGEVVHISASAVGLAALFRTAPLLFDAVRLGGAAYLVLLGIRALRNRNQGIGGNVEQNTSSDRTYWRGLLTNLLNPKMALFSIAFLPQFVDPRAGNIALQFLLLGACFVALEIAVDGSVGLLAGRLRHLLASMRFRRNLNIGAGAIFLGLGAKVALER
jgi:threonine/homoserine/homoserine lactone efflux protein